jgi:hypothetical protein
MLAIDPLCVAKLTVRPPGGTSDVRPLGDYPLCEVEQGALDTQRAKAFLAKDPAASSAGNSPLCEVEKGDAATEHSQGFLAKDPAASNEGNSPRCEIEKSAAVAER